MSDPGADRIEFMVPYVGDPDLLKAAVNSALVQSDPGWTLCVVEDGPQDAGVAQWVRDLRDPRVTHVRNETTVGLNANFQRCLDLSSSAHVVFLGCDDVLHDDYVAVVRRTSTLWPGASAVLPGVAVIDRHGRPVDPLADRMKRRLAPRASVSTSYAGEALAVSLLHGNWTYFPSICWRREHIAGFGFRQDLPVALDLALLFDVLLDGGSVVTTPEVVFSYRRHADSASSKAARASERFDEEARFFGELRHRCLARGWTHAARAARLRLTSRLHAATLVPATLGAGQGRLAARMLRGAVLA